MIVIGASLGGMKAVRSILQGLRADFPAPIAVTLHRHKESDEMLVEYLAAKVPLSVTEVIDKEPILPGHVYLAPADYHLFVERDYFSLSTDELVLFARPSIDVLFESAADTLGTEVVGVVLTGANQDGSKGAARIKVCGGIIIVQDPETAECPIMPLATLQATRADYIRPVAEIGPLLQELVSHPRKGS